MGRHRARHNREEILHDFDPDARTLRISFVTHDGNLFGVTYKLCPLCGVTMEEQTPGEDFRHQCTLCGFTTI